MTWLLCTALSTAAGATDAFPSKSGGPVGPDGCADMSPEKRRRFVYAEVICDAVELVGCEHGYENELGVALGMTAEQIYGLLGLEVDF